MHQAWSKRQVKGCSYEGYTNIGVCIRYGANVKSRPLCSREGCTNHVVGREERGKRGECKCVEAWGKIKLNDAPTKDA